jgi:hypothetical protein
MIQVTRKPQGLLRAWLGYSRGFAVLISLPLAVRLLLDLPRWPLAARDWTVIGLAVLAVGGLSLLLPGLLFGIAALFHQASTPEEKGAAHSIAEALQAGSPNDQRKSRAQFAAWIVAGSRANGGKAVMAVLAGSGALLIGLVGWHTPYRVLALMVCAGLLLIALALFVTANRAESEWRRANPFGQWRRPGGDPT